MQKTIKKGATGNVVCVAQYLTGYAMALMASGIFDADFKAHVIAWQKEHFLDADGIIGPATWKAMAVNAPLTTTAKNKNGVYVCAIQHLLNVPTVNGVFNEQTKAAVVSFQTSYGLSTDGKVGPMTWLALITEEQQTAPTGKFVQPVDYKQGDSRWGKKVYSRNNNKSQTMSNSGCGPTACANVVATLIDKSVTPWTLAELSMKWGTRTLSSGTSWSFFKRVFEYYPGFSKFTQTSSLATAKACVDAGGYVVCSMGPGYWTKAGHFITMWQYENGYIYCNDPASKVRKKQKEADFTKQRKQFFCFYK